MKLKLKWFESNSKTYPIPYDQENKSIVLDILCYAIHLQHEKTLKAIYVRNEMYHLALFYNSYAQQSRALAQVTDDDIESFREADLKRMKKKSKSSEKSLKKVVNQRLVRIYEFFAWMQEYYGLKRLLGNNSCQITSNLNIYRTTKQLPNKKNSFPLLFTLSGSSARHSTQHQATEMEVSTLTEYFFTHFNTYIAQRNILMMKVSEEMSLRRGSINSLRCSQFSDDKLEQTQDDFILVTPDTQKFDYSIQYKCPLHLALRINHFINNFHKKFMSSKGFTTLSTKDRLFISTTAGTPLADQTISAIFGQAFKAIGVTAPRVAIHSMRRKFAMDEIKSEIIGRHRMGLDTSDLSIASSVSLSMGQTNPKSLQPYVSRVQMELLYKREADRDTKVTELENENKKLRAELLRLSSE